MTSRRRHWPNRTVGPDGAKLCHQGHQLTSDNTYVYYGRKRGNPYVYRICKECRKIAARRWYERKAMAKKKIFDFTKPIPRWTAACKAQFLKVLAALNEADANALLALHGISIDELALWRQLNAVGPSALRATRLKDHRSAWGKTASGDTALETAPERETPEC